MHRSRTLHRCAVLGLTAVLATGCSGVSEPEPEKPASQGSAAPSPTAPSPTASGPSSSPAAQEVAPEDDAPAPGDGTLGRDSIRLGAPERKQVAQGLDDFVRGQHDLLSDPKVWAADDDVTVPGVAGSALTDLMVTSEEYARNGWRVVGRPKVVAQQVVRRTDDPAGLVVRVCVDNSDVRVEEADGSVVPHGSGSGRTLNVVSLSQDGGDWVVTAQRVATRPDC